MSLAAEYARTNAATAIHGYAVIATDYDLTHVGRIVDLALACIDNELARLLPPQVDTGEGRVSPSPTNLPRVDKGNAVGRSGASVDLKGTTPFEAGPRRNLRVLGRDS